MAKTSSLGDLGDPTGTIKATVIEGARGVGLPFATIILSGVLSAVAFGIQMVQHAFEMRQANVENGFRFYFDNRSALAARSDADKEMSLLKLIGNAFPNVYCDVREDLYQRTTSADVASANGGPAPFGEPDRKNLISFLVAHDRPTSPQFATGIFAIVGGALASSGGPSTPAPCPVLGQQQQFAALQVQAQAPAPAATSKEKQQGQTAAVSAGESESSNAAQAVDGRVFRVFFHIGFSPQRSTDIADKFRDELANDHYRVMHGVIRVEHIPAEGEVRYFGPEEKDAAERLAAYLTDKFRGEKLPFTAKAIGESFPWMSPDNIEVWIPDPKGAVRSKAPAPANADG
jgi:hypothetical protein